MYFLEHMVPYHMWSAWASWAIEIDMYICTICIYIYIIISYILCYIYYIIYIILCYMCIILYYYYYHYYYYILYYVILCYIYIIIYYYIYIRIINACLEMFLLFSSDPWSMEPREITRSSATLPDCPAARGSCWRCEARWGSVRLGEARWILSEASIDTLRVVPSSFRTQKQLGRSPLKLKQGHPAW